MLFEKSKTMRNYAMTLTNHDSILLIRVTSESKLNFDIAELLMANNHVSEQSCACPNINLR